MRHLEKIWIIINDLCDYIDNILLNYGGLDYEIRKKLCSACH